MDELRKGIVIGMLFGSGSEGHGNLMTKTATENGVYTAAEEIDPETGEIFDPPKDGYSVFTVDLALDDKSVSFTTSQITGSQTAEFEYDPHDENPELEGYSLFIIDLSAVKNDIEDLQQQVSDLEDELEACHDCWEDVVAALQVYDPTYDPAEGECPAPKVGEIVDHAKDCDDCKAEVVAKLQEYDPDFDPQTCEDIVDEIDDVYQKGRDDEAEENPPGVTVPDGVDPAPIALELNGTVTDDDIQASVQIVFRVSSSPDVYVPISKLTFDDGYNTAVPFVKVSYVRYGEQVTEYYISGTYGLSVSGDYLAVTDCVIDSTTGSITITKHWRITSWHVEEYDFVDTVVTLTELIGFGDTGHTQRITN